MNRRNLITAAPAVLAGMAAPSFAGVSTESEILRLYAEWEAMDAAANASDLSDEAFAVTYAAPLADLQSRILAIPAKTAPEVAAKVLLVSAGGEIADGSAASAALFSDLRALAGGVV